MVGNITAYVISLVFTYFVARNLGAENYGYYKLSITVTGIIGALSFLGLGVGIKRYIPIARKEDNELRIWGIIQIGVGIPFLVGMFLTFLSLACSDLIATEIFNKPDFAPYFRLMCLAIPIGTIMGSFAEISIAFKKIQFTVLSREIVTNAVKLILSIIAINVGMGLIGVIGATIIAVAIGAVLMVYFVHRIFNLRRPIKSAERQTKEILTFSLPVFLSRLLNQFSKNLETMVLGVFGIIAEVGVYSVLINISSIGKMGFRAIRRISYPIFAEFHSKGQMKELKAFYRTTAKWSLIINLPIFLVIVIFSKHLLNIFGEEFVIGNVGLVILAVGVLFDAATGSCGAVLNMAGYSRVNFINSIVYLVTTILLDLILIPKYGLLGAAAAGAITRVIVNTIMMIEAYYLIDRLIPVDRSFGVLFIAAIISGASTYYLLDYVLVESMVWQFVVLSLFMTGIFFGIVALQLSKEDKLVLNSVINKIKKK